MPATYQTGVYLDEGGNRLVCSPSGTILIEDGGTLTIGAAGSVAAGSTFTSDVTLSSGADLVFSGATGKCQVVVPDNLAEALKVVEGSTAYLTFVTTNGSEGITVGVPLTLADAKDVAVGTTTGSKIGTGATQKLGFFGATPVVQPAAAGQVALTDSSGGTASDTIAAIGATYTQAEVRNAVASLAAKVNTLRTALVNLGLIKGSA